MKKIFIILLTLFITWGISFAQFPNNTNREQARKNFEKRLNLSEKQKEKAAEIHKKGASQMKIIIYDREIKRQEIEKIKTSEMTDVQKTDKIGVLEQEIKKLDQKASTIRKENSREFENILNKKQKKELEIMKAEGRANFAKRHPVKPPFGYFNSPNMWESKRLFPQFMPIHHEFAK